MNQDLKKMLASWGRAFLTAALALVAAGEQDPKNIAYAGALATIPPIMHRLEVDVLGPKNNP